MPYFISETNGRRAAAFDAMVGATTEALRNPEVIARLGGFATELISAADGLFLPDIRHGIASLPANPDGLTYGVLPVPDVGAKRLAVIDRSMMLQPPRREARMAAVLDGATLSPDQPPLAVPGVNTNAPAAVTIAIFGDHNRQYMARPFICFNQALANDPAEAGILPTILTHEVQHALDYDDGLYDLQGLSSRVRAELRAYHVGSAVFDAMAVAEEPDWLTQQRTATSQYVESQRRLHAPAGDPFAPTERMTQLLLSMGLLHMD